jgi:hypothetical protein
MFFLFQILTGARELPTLFEVNHPTAKFDIVRKSEQGEK